MSSTAKLLFIIQIFFVNWFTHWQTQIGDEVFNEFIVQETIKFSVVSIAIFRTKKMVRTRRSGNYKNAPNSNEKANEPQPMVDANSAQRTSAFYVHMPAVPRFEANVDKCQLYHETLKHYFNAQASIKLQNRWQNTINYLMVVWTNTN